MYAIIRTGGKQAKVAVGDVIDVERLRAEDEVTFTPLLLVDDDGNVTSSRAELADAKVVAKVLGPSAGPKIDIFKYKAKTGYRRRQGHRQKYTRIEVVGISAAPAAENPPEEEKKPKAKPKAKAADEQPTTDKATAVAEKPKAKAKAADEKPTTDEATAVAEKPKAKAKAADEKPKTDEATAVAEKPKPKAKAKASDDTSSAADDADAAPDSEEE